LRELLSLDRLVSKASHSQVQVSVFLLEMRVNTNHPQAQQRSIQWQGRRRCRVGTGLIGLTIQDPLLATGRAAVECFPPLRFELIAQNVVAEATYQLQLSMFSQSLGVHSKVS